MMMVIVYIQSRRGVIHYGLNGMESSWAVKKGCQQGPCFHCSGILEQELQM
jgi:hypothetical protein